MRGSGVVSFCVMVPAAVKAVKWSQHHPHGASAKVIIKAAQPEPISAKVSSYSDQNTQTHTRIYLPFTRWCGNNQFK